MLNQRPPSNAFPGGSAAPSWMEYLAKCFIRDGGQEKNIRGCFARARAGFAGVYIHDTEAKAARLPQKPHSCPLCPWQSPRHVCSRKAETVIVGYTLSQSG